MALLCNDIRMDENKHNKLGVCIAPLLKDTCDPLQSTIRELKAKAIEELHINDLEVQIWDFFNGLPHGILEPYLDQNLVAAKIMPRQQILLQHKVVRLHHLHADKYVSSHI
jgi:hypothetical protein